MEVRTVRITPPLETMTSDHALKAPALADAANIDLITYFKQRGYGQFLSHCKLVIRLYTKFANMIKSVL